MKNIKILESGNKLSYEDLRNFYNQYFSLKNLGNDISNKGALIMLICWVYNKLKEKNPNVTMWQVVWKLGKDTNSSEDFLKGLSIICEDWAYNVSKVPTWNIPEKEIPKKIKELLKEQLPF